MTIKRLHPITIVIYCLFCILVPFLLTNPIITVLTSLAGFLLCFVCCREVLKRCRFAFPLCLLVALLNPIFVHNGETVLLYVNNNRITLEACLYGIHGGLLLFASILWFGILGVLLGREQILYLLSGLSPKTALVLSMCLRFFPLYREQSVTTAGEQELLFGEIGDSIPERFVFRMHHFGGMLTWALEHSQGTADSILYRADLSHKYKRLHTYSFRPVDICLCGSCVALFVLCCLSPVRGKIAVHFYPSLAVPALTATPLLIAVACFSTELIPIIREIIKKGA